MKRIFDPLLAALCLGVAFYAVVAYSALPLGAVLHPDIRASFAAHHVVVVYLHVFGAAVALVRAAAVLAGAARALAAPAPVARWCLPRGGRGRRRAVRPGTVLERLRRDRVARRLCDAGRALDGDRHRRAAAHPPRRRARTPPLDDAQLRAHARGRRLAAVPSGVHAGRSALGGVLSGGGVAVLGAQPRGGRAACWAAIAMATQRRSGSHRCHRPPCVGNATRR